MEDRTYTIEINADRAHVWQIMLEPGKYERWASAFSENSTFEGQWEKGATVRFVDPNLGGTKAVLEVFDPYNCIVAKHVSIITEAGIEETESESAKQWIGTIEKYVLSEKNGKTTLMIEMRTHKSFVEMFDSCWPKALQIIKLLSEK